METRPGPHSSHALRRALMGNAVFSTLSGVGILIFASSLAKMMGMSVTTPLYVVAPGLLLFGFSVFANARSKVFNLSNASSTVVMDVLWVIGSCMLLVVPIGLSGIGKVLIAIVALIVGFFAIWQWRGLQKIKKNQELK